MGQKIEYDPDDWAEEPEDSNDTVSMSDTVTGYEAFEDLDDALAGFETLADKRTAYADSDTLAAISPEDKILFNRQLEDLFELLELEQNDDKESGFKIYQTDSSPSKPWRFH